MFALGVILLFTARDFDETELKTLVYAFLAFAGSEGLIQHIQKQ